MSSPLSRLTLMLVILAACGRDAAPGGPPSATGSPPASSAPAPTGKVIVVEMITDGSGNYFKPDEIEASPGDVIRYTLGVGVHNVHFVADSSPGVAGLPPAGDMLQLPGQTWDFTVPAASGKKLFFQCDPHAALGMVGHVVVK